MSSRVPWPAPETREDWGSRLRERMQWLESPLAAYYLLMSTTAILVVFGLIMVLSASSVTSYLETRSAFSQFVNQAIFAVLGLAAALVMSRVSVKVLKRATLLLFLFAAVLQALVMVPGIGVEILGNRNWIQLPGFRLQPSEIGKIALILTVALILDRRRSQLHDVKKSVLPTFWYVGLLAGLVMLGKDLGTTMVIGSIYLGMLWVAGARRALFGWLLALVVVLLPLAVMTSGNRTSRINSWLGDCSNARIDGCYQKVHGMYALADGGLWGLGPGASIEKWQWLPEAHNDFIFAIIGEELGLPGSLAVLALYLVFVYACYRLIAQSDDMFVRVVTAGVMVWVGFQAVVNIGSVLGLLPIIGVPLPFISAGGTALVSTLTAVGILLSFARSDPAAAAALRERPRRTRHTSAVLPRRKARP